MSKPKEFKVRIQWDSRYWLVSAQIGNQVVYGIGDTFTEAFKDFGDCIEGLDGSITRYGEQGKCNAELLADWRRFVPEKPKGKKK